MYTLHIDLRILWMVPWLVVYTSMLASSAMPLYGRRKNEALEEELVPLLAGSILVAETQIGKLFFCMLLKTLLPHLTISSLAQDYIL